MKNLAPTKKQLPFLFHVRKFSKQPFDEKLSGMSERKDKIESSVNSRPLAPEPSARHAFGDMTTQGVSWELQERQWVRGGEGKD